MEDKSLSPKRKSFPRTSRSPSPPLPPVVTPGLSSETVSLLENLEFGEIIGQGSFGKVYICWSAAENKTYATKKIQLDEADATRFELAKEEVANMIKVNHAGLLPLVASLTWSTYIHMVMPLMSYSSCSSIIETAYPNGMPEGAIGIIIRDILQAVVYLHSKNIIHRTIKGSHILINEDGAAVLSGFRHLMEIPPNQSVMTDRNVMNDMGQYINWTSPEMLLQDSRGFGLNSDIYSIGITICELGNGVVPYADVSPSGVLAKKLEEPPPKLWDRHFLPSHESRGVTPPFPQADAPGILRTSPDHPYQRKEYSKHILNFLNVCTPTSMETRITSDQAVKFKFVLLYGNEKPRAIFKYLTRLVPLQFKRTVTAAATHAQQPSTSEAWDFSD